MAPAPGRERAYRLGGRAAEGPTANCVVTILPREIAFQIGSTKCAVQQLPAASPA
jgi:hypothetical protein